MMMLVMANPNGESLNEDLKRSIRDANKAFAAAVDPFLQRQFESDGVPSRLCHYTDFGGLKGILETGSLWATYSRTLNDASEQEYGENVVREFVTRLRNEGAGDRLAVAMGSSPQRDFVSCFCDSSRVLSMWISYGGRGGGYCLEFDGPVMLQSLFPLFSRKRQFRMTYGDVPQAVGSLLKYACQFALRGDVETIVSAGWARLMALKFKHPAFEHENEWRIVIPDPPLSTLKFRAGYADIKPYINLCPGAGDAPPRLPLKKVVFGPTLRHDDMLLESITLMLEHYGYEGVPVEPSGVPYRH